MLAAHTVALVVGAALIAAGDRLCRAVTSALRAFVGELPGMLRDGRGGCGDRRRSAVALCAASRRVGVSSWAAGQPRPLTDTPFTDNRKP